MPNCPRCNSVDCVSHRFENVSFDEVAGGALAAKRSGHLAHALSALAIWACVESANYFREDWRCNYCGHTF